MAVTRVTQRMMFEGSMHNLQQQLARLAKTQESLSSGRTMNRPSDDPTGVSSSLRIRSALSDQQQYARNADDGVGWMATIDTSLQSVLDQVRTARDRTLQGLNTGSVSQAGRDALAAEVEQIRTGLISMANAKYLERPVFGGLTGGGQAFDDNGVYVGVTGEVNRVVADGVTIAVNADGEAVFGGPAGSGQAQLFQDLEDLAIAIRANDETAMAAGMTALNARLDAITTVLSDVGTRYNRLNVATEMAKDSELSLSEGLANLENTDLARATVDLQMHEVAYQAALAATARVTQPSLMDFLR